MRLIFCFFMISTFCFSQNKKHASKQKDQNKTFTISGKVTISYSHCGGAMLDQQSMKEITQPKPYSGKVFYIREGAINDLNKPIITSFTVDANGNFELKLPKGTFSIIQKEQVQQLDTSKYESNQYYIVDRSCMQKWWLAPYHLLEVNNKNITDLEFNFHKRCFIEGDLPCIDYHGPLPP